MLDEILARVANMGEEEKKQITAAAMTVSGGKKFIPSPGPQFEAYVSKADILLFGGSGGGGKSALINGLALNEHRRSLIVRRKFADLGALTEDIVKFNGTRKGFISAPRPRLRTVDGRLVEFGACQHLGDEQSFQGNPHDFLGIDEATQILESQVRFLMGWVRTTVEGQRTRVVLATNPPISSEGDWIINMFRPWLDPTHPNPATSGELRWFITDEGGRDEEVDGPGIVERGAQKYQPMSRSFIPASVKDNPFLADTDYQAKLDALPEPLRSAVRDGNFMAVRADDEFQVIPSDWVRAAQMRWKPVPYPGIPMCAMGVDVARGGVDDTVIAMRYDGWYAPLVIAPGRETPEGTDVAALVVKHRRDDAEIVVDMGGGYGGAPYEHLKATLGHDRVHEFIPGGGGVGRTGDGNLRFANKRAEAWWRFREALDPSSNYKDIIHLPVDDIMLVADLTSPRLDPAYLQKGIVKIEAKEDIKKRLGRSPDRGDAVVMAWSEGNRALATHLTWDVPIHRISPSLRQSGGRVVDKYAHRRR